MLFGDKHNLSEGGPGRFAALLQWRVLVLAGFIGPLLVFATFKPGPPSIYKAVMNLGQLVGPLIAVLWCIPGWRRTKDEPLTNRATFSVVCLLLGVFGFSAGQAVWSYDEIILHQPTPFPSWADAAFVGSYLFLFVGILKLPSRPIPLLARWRILLDSVTSMAALVTFSWYFILAPQLAQGSQSALGKALGILYPLSDLALLFCLLMLAGGRARPGTRGAILNLSAGLLCVIVIDTAFAVATLHNLYQTGGLLDLLWPLGYMLIGLGAWQLHRAGQAARDLPQNEQQQQPAPQGPSLWQSLLPYAFMPPAIALLCFVYGVGGWDWRSWGVYGGAAILMMLVLARQFFVVCENERLYRKLEDLYRQLTKSHHALEEANQQLHSLATTDGMTRLANHRALQERLREEAARSRRTGEPVSLVLIDVDRFKQFNDTFGHPAGDDILRKIGSLMRACVRENDLTARYGGEEFAIVIPGADSAAAGQVAERIRNMVADHPFEHRPVTISVGVACTLTAGYDPDDILRSADQALYRSKSTGRNQVTLATTARAA